MYWQALLDEVNTAKGVDSVTYNDWVKVTANAGKDAMTAAVGKLCTQLLKKAEGKEQWTNLPATAQGGSVRDMKHSVCHIMSMTLRLGGTGLGALLSSPATAVVKLIYQTPSGSLVRHSAASVPIHSALRACG